MRKGLKIYLISYVVVLVAIAIVLAVVLTLYTPKVPEISMEKAQVNYADFDQSTNTAYLNMTFFVVVNNENYIGIKLDGLEFTVYDVNDEEETYLGLATSGAFEIYKRSNTTVEVPFLFAPDDWSGIVPRYAIAYAAHTAVHMRINGTVALPVTWTSYDIYFDTTQKVYL